MNKKVIACVLLFFVLIFSCSCDNNQSNSGSYFCITFINVGQGDSAFVECDGQCMLIDGGGAEGGEKVKRMLSDKGISRLDVLAISHLHEDHVGGLEKALDNITRIDYTICNAKLNNNENYQGLNAKIIDRHSSVKIPEEGKKIELGQAVVEVVDVSSKNENDSLVLMVSYKETKYLFTGDIEYEAQKRIAEKYHDELYKVDVMKVPHHGSYNNDTLIRFVNVFMPDYAVISCGINNRYGHPDQKTLKLFEDAKAKIFRTDRDGNIVIRSNGKNVDVRTER